MVSDEVTKHVVNTFKMVNVDHEKRQVAIISLGSFDFLTENFFKCISIIKTGQGIFHSINMGLAIFEPSFDGIKELRHFKRFYQTIMNFVLKKKPQVINRRIFRKQNDGRMTNNGSTSFRKF